MKKIPFWKRIWYKMTEPTGSGRLFGGGMPKNFYVIYNEGGKSIPMAYDTACSYAEMFGGVVQKVEK